MAGDRASSETLTGLSADCHEDVAVLHRLSDGDLDGDDLYWRTLHGDTPLPLLIERPSNKGACRSVSSAETRQEQSITPFETVFFVPLTYACRN